MKELRQAKAEGNRELMTLKRPLVEAMNYLSASAASGLIEKHAAQGVLDQLRIILEGDDDDSTVDTPEH